MHYSTTNGRRHHHIFPTREPCGRGVVNKAWTPFEKRSKPARIPSKKMSLFRWTPLHLQEPLGMLGTSFWQRRHPPRSLVLIKSSSSAVAPATSSTCDYMLTRRSCACGGGGAGGLGKIAGMAGAIVGVGATQAFQKSLAQLTTLTTHPPRHQQLEPPLVLS